LSDIRVTYSGLIAFVVGIIGIIIGLLFTLIITRKLSPEEFGIWGLIGSIITYFLISEAVFSTWSTRQIARGEEIGKSSLVSSGLFSLGAIPIYILYVFFIGNNSNVDFGILLFGVILLPLNFLSQSLTAINLAHKPQATSFSLVFFQLLKIPAALAFVVFFELGVEGAIFALFVSFIAKIILQMYFAKHKLKNKFSSAMLRRWLRLSWIPLYSTIPRYISGLDVVLYSILTGSVIGIAFFTVSFSIARIVSHSGSISQAVYPKILSEKKFVNIKENLNLTMYFSLPLLGISVIFAEPALFALNPKYQEATFIVILLSFRVFAYILSQIPLAILGGSEKVDIEHNPTFSKLLHSRLFKVPTIVSIFSFIYLSLLVLLLVFTKSDQINEIELVTWWALIYLCVEIPITISLWLYAKKLISFSIQLKNIVKYLGATIIFSMVYLLTSDYILNYNPSIYYFLPSLLLQLGICVGIYLGITYIVDKNTRNLFKSILKEI